MEKVREMGNKLFAKVANAMTKKREGIDNFITVIIIIVIAIGVGFIFRQQIVAFITNFFAQFATQTQALF